MIQTKVMVTDKTEDVNLNIGTPINRLTPNLENKRILAYSAKKIKTNPKEEYSILNPETNSDSPSEKSKGVRLVSAIIIINHRINNIGPIKIIKKDLDSILEKWTLIVITANTIKIKANLISYEIV